MKRIFDSNFPCRPLDGDEIVKLYQKVSTAINNLYQEICNRDRFHPRELSSVILKEVSITEGRFCLMKDNADPVNDKPIDS